MRPDSRLSRPLLALLLAAAFAPSALAQTETDSWRLNTLPAPEFKRTPPRAVAPRRGAPRLTLLSTRPNQITDEEAWFARHSLSLPVYEISDAPSYGQQSTAEPLPSFVPLRFRGARLVRAIRQPERVLAVYGADFSSGRYLVALDRATGRFSYGFDFTNYAYAPDAPPREREFIYQNVAWAAEEGDTLYVAHAHNTYARSSRGMNAYVTAIDTRRGRVLWRSAPLVANASNFELWGDHLVTGYGFTQEPDFVYLLDKRTGEVRQRVAVRSGPSYLIRKGDRLHVRAYDADLILRLAGAR
jgi:outer membrane protein assembly factor BamB